MRSNVIAFSIYYKFTLFIRIHVYVPKAENTYVVIFSFKNIFFFFTKYAGIAKLDFKITTYFSNKT